MFNETQDASLAAVAPHPTNVQPVPAPGSSLDSDAAARGSWWPTWLSTPAHHSAVAAWVQTLGVIVSLAFIAWQVALLERQITLSQEAQLENISRSKREATMSFVIGMSRGYRAVDYEICGVENGIPMRLTSQRVAEVLENPSLRVKAQDFLGEFEWMATGVQTDTLDFEVVNRMRGSYLLDVYRRWTPFMNAVIRLTPPGSRRLTLLDQLEGLSRRLAATRNIEFEPLVRE